jgi:hypothetical protein
MNDLRFIFPFILILFVFILIYKNRLSLDLSLLVLFSISSIFLLANSKKFILNFALFFDIIYPPLVIIIALICLIILSLILIMVMFTEYRNRQDFLLIKISEIELMYNVNINAIKRDLAGGQATGNHPQEPKV